LRARSDGLFSGQLGRLLKLLDDVATCPQRQLGAVAKLAQREIGSVECAAHQRPPGPAGGPGDAQRKRLARSSAHVSIIPMISRRRCATSVGLRCGIKG
jgi:hypothetical protein